MFLISHGESTIIALQKKKCIDLSVFWGKENPHNVFDSTVQPMEEIGFSTKYGVLWWSRHFGAGILLFI